MLLLINFCSSEHTSCCTAHFIVFSSIEHVDFDQLPNIDKTTILMNTSPRQTAKYLVGAFKKRKTFYIQGMSCSIHVYFNYNAIL